MSQERLSTLNVLCIERDKQILMNSSTNLLWKRPGLKLFICLLYYVQRLLIVAFYFVTHISIGDRVFERASFLSPNPTRARPLFLKRDLRSKAKFTEWVVICATAGCQKTCSTGVAADTRFYHTRNNNYLD